MFGKYLNKVPDFVPTGFDAWMANNGGNMARVTWPTPLPLLALSGGGRGLTACSAVPRDRCGVVRWAQATIWAQPSLRATPARASRTPACATARARRRSTTSRSPTTPPLSSATYLSSGFTRSSRRAPAACPSSRTSLPRQRTSVRQTPDALPCSPALPCLLARLAGPLTRGAPPTLARHVAFNPAPWYHDHWDPSWPAHEPRPVSWNCSAESRRNHHGNIATEVGHSS